MNLPETTTERLLAVADIIELEPEKWEQSAWYFNDGEGRNCDVCSPASVAGDRPPCGTTACIAGWAVVLNPQFGALLGASWHMAGAVSLGLDHELALNLFDADLTGTPAEVADLLRHIAKLPAGKRTIGNLEAILPDKLVTVLRTGDGSDD